MMKMREMRPQLTAQQCDEWVRLLHEQARVLEPDSVRARRDRAFSDRTSHWAERLRWRFWEMTRNPRHGPLSHERMRRAHLASRRSLANVLGANSAKHECRPDE
jgi:hypothetical protein